MNFSVWIEAARLRTLPASLVPVMTGGALAWQHGLFNGWITSVALFSAILIQVATNFANDYFDFLKGADNDERVGFTRASSTGAVAPRTMLAAAFVSFLMAFLLGLILVSHAGWPILAIGLLSIAAGVLYTGGPFPLAYNGLGDVFVFLFFGLAAVMGTYYVNTLEWSAESFWAAVAVGALSTMILVANNYRDVDTDRKVNKRTLAVLLGERFSRWQFLVLMMLAFSIPPHFYFRESYPLVILLPMILLPWGVLLVRAFWRETDKAVFNGILVNTARLMTAFGLLFATGIVLS
ncbi:1,4-dihydroxy-2-naphthoate polyprenyltransferase [Balneolales bacterium ANBcel1]|nr:1,4-dihydroxy-2-naphthoate polyprenyltransferase [Balneolales bacterium ANBcel1]